MEGRAQQSKEEGKEEGEQQQGRKKRKEIKRSQNEYNMTKQSQLKGKLLVK